MASKTVERDKQLGLERVNARITREAMDRLQSECYRRYCAKAGRCAYGEVLTELCMKLPEASGDGLKVKKGPSRARVKTMRLASA